MPARVFDRESDTWMIVRTRLDELRHDALARALAPGTDFPDTQFQRGVLAALDQIGALADPPPPAPNTQTEIY